MNKLTAKQILEIVEKNYEVSPFAFGEWDELKDESDVTFDYERADRIGEEKDRFWKSIENQLPHNYKERQEHPLFKQYLSMDTKYGDLEKQALEQLGLGGVEEVARYGGEGKGEVWYSVKHFVDSIQGYVLWKMFNDVILKLPSIRGLIV